MCPLIFQHFNIIKIVFQHSECNLISIIHIIKILIKEQMKFQSSDIFSPKSIKTSIHQQNSTFSSPYQSRHPKQFEEKDLIRIYTLKIKSPFQKQKIYCRSNLTIQYIPQFTVISENNLSITIKAKQYSLELLPWLIKKDSLFKVNIVLGIYIAFLELIEQYGLFPIHPNMMKVNEKQQVAVWINKNFQAFQPDQVLTKNAFSMKEFMKSFLRIFKCCLPSKKISEMHNDQKQLLTQLVKIKRKEQMHKNCHQFLKHNTKISNSRKSNKCVSTLFIQTKKQISEKISKTQIIQNQINNRNFIKERFSTIINTRFSSSPKKKLNRLSSFSPNKNQQKSTSLKKRFSRTGGFKSQKNLAISALFLKKKSEQVASKQNQQSFRTSKKQMSISSTGQLFKKYLMYSSSKFQKMSNSSHPQGQASQKNPVSRQFIFRSDVHRLTDNNAFSQTIIQEPNGFFTVSQKKIQQFTENALFSPIKFRKMSSNTNQKRIENEKKKVGNSGNWRMTYKQQDNYIFGQERDNSPKADGKQHLKNSFPYKTASTLTSFRLSNQHQYSMFPSKSEQNLNPFSISSSSIPLCIKQKDKKFQQMKIVQQNELQSDFNNIFSLENSNLKRQDQQKRLESIITQFQQVLF